MQEYVSSYIGLPLLTCGGERIGYIKNVQTDKNLTRIRNLECCDNDDEEFILPITAVANFGEGAAVVRCPSARGCKNCLPAPIGKEVFSTSGDPLGRVRDFGREGAFIQTVLLSDGRELPVQRVTGVTDAVLIDLSENFAPRPVSRTRKRPTQAARAGDAGSLPLPETSGDNSGPPARPEREKEHAPGAAANENLPNGAANKDIPGGAANESVPDAATYGAEESSAARTEASPGDGAPAAERQRSSARRAGSGLLTGKVLPADLLDPRGNVLARAGTTVDAEVIRRAMRHEKLFELTLLCCSSSPLGIFR